MRGEGVCCETGKERLERGKRGGGGRCGGVYERKSPQHRLTSRSDGKKVARYLETRICKVIAGGSRLELSGDSRISEGVSVFLLS